RTLRALFRVTLRRDGGAQSSRGALVVARPDRLRLQLFSLGFITVFDYTASADRYCLRRPLEAEARVGRFPEGDGDALAWDLRPLFLRGEIERARVTGGDDDVWTAIVEERTGERILRISRRDSTIESESFLVEGRAKFRARYSDYRPVDGVPLPFRIEIDDPVHETTIAIDVERYARNDAVESSVFEICRGGTIGRSDEAQKSH
ncbi:MAG: hypothetical protein ACREQ9_09465, partial [Candidatus Binatia bacterium]